MLLGLRARDLLAITVLTLAVVATTSAVLMMRLARIGVEEAGDRAERQVYQIAALAQVALAQAPQLPPEQAIAEDRALKVLLDATLVHSSEIVYAAIVGGDGELVAAGATTPDRSPPVAPPLAELEQAGDLDRLWRILRSGTLVETDLPLVLDGRPFGRVRLGLDTSLLRARLRTALAGSAGLAVLALALSWLVAVGTARLTRRPIRRLSREIERLRLGESLLESADWDLDFAELASQLRLLGDELKSERVSRLAATRTLQEVLDHLEDGVLLTDEDDVVLFYNRALAGVIGRPFTEARDLALGELLPATHPLVQLARRARLEERDLERVHASLQADGRFEEAAVSAFRVRRNEEAPGLLLLAADLGGLRTLQDLVQYSAKVTEMGRMTAGVAHEVRNPLHAMQLHLALMRERLPGDPALGHAVDAMERAIQDLGRLVEGLLDYLRPMRLERQEFDANDLVRGLAVFLEPEARRLGVRMALDLIEDKALLYGDESRLRQALLNLFQNAFEAMQGGGLLTVRTRSEGRHLRIEVEDTGRGIAPEHRDEIFHLYYTTRDEGTGIGLSIVHRIVVEHGGSIHVESELERGSTFTVRLPRAPEQPDEGGPPAAAQRR